MGAIRNPAPGQSLYERDFCEWSRRMAELLPLRSTTGLDWESVAEEIESLG